MLFIIIETALIRAFRDMSSQAFPSGIASVL